MRLRRSRRVLAEKKAGERNRAENRKRPAESDVRIGDIVNEYIANIILFHGGEFARGKLMRTRDIRRRNSFLDDNNFTSETQTVSRTI